LIGLILDIQNSYSAYLQKLDKC